MMHTYMATPYHKNPNPDGYEINNNITIYLICLIHAPVYTRGGEKHSIFTICQCPSTRAPTLRVWKFYNFC